MQSQMVLSREAFRRNARNLSRIFQICSADRLLLDEIALKPADRHFFVPLSKLVNLDRFKADELIEAIHLYGRPEGLKRSAAEGNPGAKRNYRGFTFESYVKWAIRRVGFQGYPLSAHSCGSGTLGANLTYSSDAWGNVKFYENGVHSVRTVAEIDGLYTYDREIPVILEASLTHHPINSDVKRRLVSELYPGSVPIILTVRPEGRDEPGLYFSKKELLRGLVVPWSPTLAVVADYFLNEDKKEKLTE